MPGCFCKRRWTTMCVVGPDRHPNGESNALAATPRRSNVRVLPQQEEKQLAQTLARTAIYAATSQYEPFGLAPVEAALSKCALVASDIPSFRELWDGAAGFF